MTRKRKQTMKASDAMDLVPDNIGDGAAMMMASEFSGMDYESLCMDLVAEQEERDATAKAKGK